MKRMRFDRADAVTFALGWAAAMLLEIGLILKDLEAEPDWSRLGMSLIVGTLSATGRYLVSRVPELMRE